MRCHQPDAKISEIDENEIDDTNLSENTQEFIV